MRRGLRACAALLTLAGCMPSHRMTPELAPGRTCPGADGFAWYFPDGPGDHARLEDWCVTVGPPVVRLQPSGVFPDLLPGEELAVLSWNVDVGGGDALGFLEREASVRCAGAESTLDAGAAHFALLAQEAFRSSADVPESANPRVIPRAVEEEIRPGGRPDIVEIASRCGLSLAYVAAARNGSRGSDGRREDKGVAILSTLSLSDVTFIELPYEAGRRVAVAATVRDRVGRGLRLVNLHLISAAAPARALTTGNGSRLRQGLAIADAVRQLEEDVRKDRPLAGLEPSTLLAGDFNTWSENESTLRHLRDVFPDSPPALGQGTRGDFPTDHILFRQGEGAAPLALGSTYARVEDRHHSDHHAIRMQVRFPH